MKRNIQSSLFGAGLLLSLGFGVSQAFASAQTEAEQAYCQTYAEMVACRRDCGAVGMYAYCDQELGCTCY
ncbi:MAG TPA: hypothetical protein VGC13_15270 [Longimicrobium sp.]|jgi:hypothetical protein|uniref:hypothetical protein n=1 Tax=Longimicrobium sp. TaxID=2029185 RepID=UPI002ED9EB85